MNVSKNALNLKPAATIVINQKCTEMLKQGVNIVNFGIGEPDFDTPEQIKQAAVKAIWDGKTKYTAATGIHELKQAIADKLKQENKLEYSPAQIVVANGAKQAIANTIAALINPGDEVLILSPAWITYPQLVLRNGGKPVFVPVKKENNYLPTLKTLEAMVTNRTKLLIINSPSNPTGRVFDDHMLEMLASFVLEHNIFIISDEVYEKIIFDGKKHISLASLSRDIYERTITINGLSKTYAMTGWRIGYSASNTQLSNIIGNIQTHDSGGINTITQWAGIQALKGDQDCVDRMVHQFEIRRNFIYEEIKGIDGMEPLFPQGAFYLFVDITEALGREYNGRFLNNAIDFATALLEEKAVAVVPCEDFGIQNHIRISYAAKEEHIVEGIKRLKEFMMGN